MRGVFVCLLFIGACAFSPAATLPNDDSPTFVPSEAGDAPSSTTDGAADLDASGVFDAPSDASNQADARLDGSIVDSGRDAAPIDAGSDASVVDSGNPPSTVTLRWNALAGYNFRIDVANQSNQWISPCFAPAELLSVASVVYDGTCPTGGAQVAKPKAYRLAYKRAIHSEWLDSRDVTPSGSPTELTFDNPTTAPTAVTLSWTDKGAGYKYSIDAELDDGTVIGPCAGELALTAGATSYVFGGQCPTPNRAAPIRRIVRFAVFYKSPTGNWGDPNTFASAQFSGLTNTARVNLP